MKRVNLESMILTEQNSLEEEPIRGIVSLLLILTDWNKVYSRIKGSELLLICREASSDLHSGWVLYAKICNKYLSMYDFISTGESDEYKGIYLIENLRKAASEVLYEIS